MDFYDIQTVSYLVAIAFLAVAYIFEEVTK